MLWSWRARKIIIPKVKRTIQQTQHHRQKSLTLTIVIESREYVHLSGKGARVQLTVTEERVQLTGRKSRVQLSLRAVLSTLSL